MMKLSVVVPCYNEEENIPLILERFEKVIKRKDIEVILVNNGSTDNTAAVLEELLPRYPFAKTTLVPVNQGYGYGILQGLKKCRGEYVGWTHADMQTDPKDIIKALHIIERVGEPVFVKGNRKGRPLFDVFFTMGMSLFESCYLRMPLYDINAQPNLFPKTFYEAWENPPHDFSLDLYALYMAGVKGLKVIRFPVLFPERIHGESKWNTGLKAKWKFIKRTIDFSVKLKKGGLR
ncbi:MAG: glycosyltransferase family 2 protein [Bacillus sp. (in: Bacteria)]|nr:glycosyltransferase family 2 protein [Bacillus sp. (in: firmicutes)]MCM1426610.1 glycosyltransferase family 2 protein [Eubacterium sp.]